MSSLRYAFNVKVLFEPMLLFRLNINCSCRIRHGSNDLGAKTALLENLNDLSVMRACDQHESQSHVERFVHLYRLHFFQKLLENCRQRKRIVDFETD